jgi:glycosyltransferase involved in cell wall biosynthesis
MISFIVPAHNEQGCLGRTLSAIHESARVVGEPYEIFVVDDASTDATAEIGREHKATVLSVKHRQIAATRNSGARAANGERLFFVDADTTINPRVVADALRWMDKGAVGGGASAWFDGPVPLYGHLIALLCVIVAKVAGFTGGAFMFCTREAFQGTGGFNERLFCGEEGAFALALKHEGRFVVLGECVRTSGRRLRTTSGLQLLAFAARAALSPFKMITRRSSVEKIWYNSNREEDEKMPSSLTVRVSNGIALLILLVLLTGPIWNFIPWSLTPLESAVGKFRFVIRAFLSHVGFIFWPLGAALFVNLLRRRHWAEWLKLAALTTFCLWQAWASTRAAIWVWSVLGRWL